MARTNTNQGGSGAGIAIGDTVLGGSPNLFLYTDAAGNLYQDGLASRDSVTNETYIGYRTGAGQFTNALQLGNFLGSLIPDGVGFQRHDAGADNYTFSIAIDGTPIGAGINTLLQGYRDFTNGIFSKISFDDFNLDAGYSSASIYGSLSINDNNARIQYSDNDTTYKVSTNYDGNGIVNRYEDIGTGRVLKSIVDATTVRGGDFGSTGGNNMRYVLDDANKFFEVSGLNSTGDMLKLDANTGLMGMGDVSNTNSHIGIYADDTNSIAYVDGLKTEVPNWTPSDLADGFTGTGLNDLHYTSTITYDGVYPNTYNIGIATVGSVYMQIASIVTPGFVTGDTVTDGSGSTGTIIGGSEADGYFIIAPIVDSGWTSATTLSDISTGASATVANVQYTDTYSWSSTDGGIGTVLPCFSFFQLDHNLQLGFDNQTGHTVGDSWTFEMTQGTVYSKMALFDGTNRKISIGDAEQTVNDVCTDWVLGTGKATGIYNYIAKARDFSVYNDEGNLLVLSYQADNNFEFNFGIYNPHNGFSTINSVSDINAYGIGIKISDVAGDHFVSIGNFNSGGNSTYISVDDDTQNIEFLADGLQTNSQDIPITAKVVLNASQLSTFGTVPIEVIPAPGTGKMIQPISAYGQYTHVTTAYANFGIPGLTHEPASGSLPLKFSVGLLSNAYNYVQFAGTANEGYNAGFTVENQPLYFTDDDSSDPTTGDGTLTLYITYKIIKL